MASRRRAFRKLILRELEEVTPFPPQAQSNGEWFQHLPKNFVHQAIFMTASAHRDFILSLPPDLVFDVYQLWDALKSRNQVQWLTFLCKLANPSFDRHGEIRKAHLQWLHLIDQDEELAQNSRNGAEARLKDANGRQRKNSIRKQAKRPAESHSPVSATEAVTRQRHTRPSGRQSTKRRTRE